MTEEERWVCARADAFFRRHFPGKKVYVQEAPKLRSVKAAANLFSEIGEKAAARARSLVSLTGNTFGRGGEEGSREGPIRAVDKDASRASSSAGRVLGRNHERWLRFCVWTEASCFATPLATANPLELPSLEASGLADLQEVARAFEQEAARRSEEGSSVACEAYAFSCVLASCLERPYFVFEAAPLAVRLSGASLGGGCCFWKFLRVDRGSCLVAEGSCLRAVSPGGVCL